MSAKVYGVLVNTGSGYRAVEGWSALWTERAEAESCAERARENSGWSAKVVSMSPFEAAENGWIAGLKNDAHYWDLRRTYGDESGQVARHLARCAAVQCRGENHT